MFRQIAVFPLFKGGILLAKQRGNTAALYCRLSRDDGGAESNSIATQKMMLGRYAKEHGFQVYSEYIDDGYTGTSLNRLL